MTKYIALFLVIAYMLGCSKSTSQETTNKNIEDTVKSSINFSKRIIDFGTLSNDTNVYARFYLRNIGAEKLIIKDVSPECSCSGYKLENNTIMPGDSTSLIIHFSTKGQREGLQRKAIIVNSNTEKEYNTLFIRCIIKNIHSRSVD